MIADELATFSGMIEALKLVLAKKKQEAHKTAENMIAVEGELKKLEHKLDEDESEPCKGPGQERQLVVT